MWVAGFTLFWIGFAVGRSSMRAAVRRAAERLAGKR